MILPRISRLLRAAAFAVVATAAAGCARSGFVSATFDSPPAPAEDGAFSISFDDAGRVDPSSLAVAGATDPYIVASLLAEPGDIVLHHLSNGAGEKIAYQLLAYPAGLIDLLDFQDPVTKYFHADVFVEANPRGIPLTRSFYPFSKRFKRGFAHESFSIYRADFSRAERADALDRALSERYPRTGVCSDFVNWAYRERLHSWWNVVPGLRAVLIRAWPPEALQTCDNLANSPRTRKICEVVRGRLVHPVAPPSPDEIRSRAAELLLDPSPRMRAHGAWMNEKLAAGPPSGGS